jgi:Cu/Ag efflux pump CusA
VSVTRATIFAAVVIYVFLWILAFNGASSLIGPLAVPLVLAVIVALGVALQRFMGLPARKQHFRDREDDTKP